MMQRRTGHVHSRIGGITPKGCLMVIGGIIGVILGIFLVLAFVANSYVKNLTGKPLAIPPEPDAAVVLPAIDKKFNAALTNPANKGKAVTVTLNSEEVDTLIRQAYPAAEAEKLHVEVKDGLARVMLSMRGPQLERQLPPEMTTIRWYVHGLPFVNLDFTCFVTYVASRWQFRVKGVKAPEGISPPQIQAVVDGLMAGSAQAPAKIQVSGKDTPVSQVELKDETAVVTIAP